MKFGPLMWFIGVVMLIILSIASVVWLGHLPMSRIFDTPTPEPTESVVPVADRVPALSLGTVAVQTFSGTTLIRTAAATVVSADGLIVTTTSGAPYGAGYFYQVMSATGAVSRAARVGYDAASALVLLKVQAADLGTVPFVETAVLRPGDSANVVAATVILSRYSPVILPVDVAYAVDERTVGLSFDKTYAALLFGARVVDGQGRTVGLLRLGAVPGIVPAAAVNAFVARYLND